MLPDREPPPLLIQICLLWLSQEIRLRLRVATSGHKPTPFMAPKRDGDATKLVNYFASFGSLLHLGDYTPVDLAKLAPIQFTGAALDWFNALTSTDRDYMTGSWGNFCKMLRDQFMGQAWINARMKEFEEMKLRQPKHSDETPFHFLQRRLKLANILYEEESDGVLISRVLREQPEAWTPHLNPSSSLHSQPISHQAAWFRARQSNEQLQADSPDPP